MRKTKITFALCLSMLALSACTSPVSSASESLFSSGSGDEGTSAFSQDSGEPSSSSSPSSEATSSSEEPVVPWPADFDGIVRIYYHNDTSDYSTKALWVWVPDQVEVGHDLSFANKDTPDDFGVYCDLDLKSEPFTSATKVEKVAFIVKSAGSWASKTTDTIVTLSNFASTLTTNADGRQVVTIYSWDLGTGELGTSAKMSEALGDRLASATFTDWRTLHVVGTGMSKDSGGSPRAAEDIGKVRSYTVYGLTPDYYKLSETKQAGQKKYLILKEASPAANAFDITFESDVLPSTSYEIDAVMELGGVKKTLFGSFIGLYDEATFTSKYTYTGSDLGVTFTSEGYPVYKLWAPTASKVMVKQYFTGCPSALAIPGHLAEDLSRDEDMTLGENGVWTFTQSNPSYATAFSFYTYSVTTAGATAECADPYAIATGINGVRSAIPYPAKMSATDPSGFASSLASLKTNHPVANPNDLSVYEVQIRDFTKDSSWVSKEGNANGTFKAFAEKGTSITDGTTLGSDGNLLSVKTGFDSLVELGPDAVQLLPVFDQDNDERTYTKTVNGASSKVEPAYNWGYNPLNYNCVEGSFSSDPFNPFTRIGEFKGVVQTLADAGIRTIMDVVYNHVSSVSASCFTKIMPKYYFRTNSAGAYSDCTGCGNETASERIMMRRYIVNSVLFWAKNYGIKGFRFDLMASLDLETMKAVKKTLYAYDPEIVVYGEGWTAGDSVLSSGERAISTNVYGSLSDIDGAGSIGCFNDGVRKGLTGDLQNNKPWYGFMASGSSDVKANSEDRYWAAYCGYLGENKNQGKNPAQTVNYISCHDNYTAYDQFNYSLGNGMAADTDSAAAKAAVVAAESYILMGNGLAFFQGGEEIFRQKLMKSDDPYFSKIKSDDGFALTSGTFLVRNSYAYGDAVNSFKWDRKPANYGYFQQLEAAFAARRTLLGQVTGLTHSQVDSQVTPWSSYGSADFVTDCIRINDKTTTGTYYIFLAGIADGNATTAVNIGSDTLNVLFSSSGYHSGSFAPAGGTLGVGRFECLVVQKA
jgi:pullulanase/glycogen debranching enzyme